ncbi:MAG: hypothetical protein ACRENQ_16245 [Gemmatimonadaceae bacterium]
MGSRRALRILTAARRERKTRDQALTARTAAEPQFRGELGDLIR